MCGSKIKKVVKSAANVATFGASGMLLDATKAPEAPSAPTAVDSTPTEVDPAVSAAREDEKRRRAAAAGLGSTILTGSQGLAAPATTGQKTLLGA